MTVALTTAARDAACNAIVDLLDAGAGAGYIEFQTAASAEAATLTFSDPAFGNSSIGVAIADTITADPGATGGVVDRFRLFDSNALEILSGSLALDERPDEAPIVAFLVVHPEESWNGFGRTH